MSYFSFEDLEVWKRGCRVAVEVCSLLRDSQEWGLRDQMMRAAVSISSNIAEGAERSTPRDFARFLDIARGSAAELRTQLYIAVRADMLPEDSASELIKELKEISAMLYSLSRQQRARVKDDSSHFTLNTSHLPPMDIVFINDLEIETVIGIYDWERRIRQTVCLNLEMGSDIGKAADTDRIEDALDYKAVAKRLIGFVEKSDFQLVETLAERCAEIVLDEFAVDWLRLRLDKPGAVRGSKSVGILIERGRRS